MEMEIRYVLNEDCHTVDGKRYIFYGITALEDGRMLLSVRDVSADRTRVEKLIETCNRLGLSPAHLGDVVEDFLLN